MDDSFLTLKLTVVRGNLSHETFLKNARNSEETLRKEALERTDISHLKGNPRLTSVEAAPDSLYQVESTGAVVSLNSAVGLIHFYCSQLPSDRYEFLVYFRIDRFRQFIFSSIWCRYSLLRPEFNMERHERPGGLIEFSCKLQLPCNAAFENLEGPSCNSMRLAQQV